MFHGIRFNQNKKNLSQMDKAMPVLFISGERDAVGGMGKGARAAFESFLKAGCTDVTCKLYPEARHEVLNEINRQEVYADVLEWLNNRICDKK